MKKSMLVFLVAGLVTISCLLWFLRAGFSFELTDLLQIGIILVVLGFAVFIGISRFRSERRGQPSEDELSKNLMKRASSLSYFISLYWWLLLMYFSDRTSLERGSFIGAGILGMAVILAVCYLFFYFRGLRDA
jgi:hypothetical protein